MTSIVVLTKLWVFLSKNVQDPLSNYTILLFLIFETVGICLWRTFRLKIGFRSVKVIMSRDCPLPMIKWNRCKKNFTGNISTTCFTDLCHPVVSWESWSLMSPFSMGWHGMVLHLFQPQATCSHFDKVFPGSTLKASTHFPYGLFLPLFPFTCPSRISLQILGW